MDMLKQVTNEILFEMGGASTTYPPMASMQEAEAVMREEMDKLTAAIRKEYKPGVDWPTPEARKKALQLGAMVMRFLTRM